MRKNLELQRKYVYHRCWKPRVRNIIQWIGCSYDIIRVQIPMMLLTKCVSCLSTWHRRGAGPAVFCLLSECNLRNLSHICVCVSMHTLVHAQPYEFIYMYVFVSLEFVSISFSECILFLPWQSTELRHACLQLSFVVIWFCRIPPRAWKFLYSVNLGHSAVIKGSQLLDK